MIGQTLSSCDPVPPALRAKVRIEVHQHIANLSWLKVGRQGTITSVAEHSRNMQRPLPDAAAATHPA